MMPPAAVCALLRHALSNWTSRARWSWRWCAFFHPPLLHWPTVSFSSRWPPLRRPLPRPNCSPSYDALRGFITTRRARRWPTSPGCAGSCGTTASVCRRRAGSHRSGRLTGKEIDRWRAEGPADACLAARGEVLAMWPLLLHASSPATSPAHRRVLHIEYAAVELPAGLEWH
jgi:hypothetical protein